MIVFDNVSQINKVNKLGKHGMIINELQYDLIKSSKVRKMSSNKNKKKQNKNY